MDRLKSWWPRDWCGKLRLNRWEKHVSLGEKLARRVLAMSSTVSVENALRAVHGDSLWWACWSCQSRFWCTHGNFRHCRRKNLISSAKWRIQQTERRTPINLSVSSVDKLLVEMRSENFCLGLWRARPWEWSHWGAKLFFMHCADVRHAEEAIYLKQ